MDCTSRTSSACRESPCLANMCFTCERIVLYLAARRRCDPVHALALRQ